MTRLKHVARVRVSNVDKKTYEGECPVRLCNYTDVYYGDVLRAGDGDWMAATASESQVREFQLAAGDTVLTKDSETADDIGVSAYIADSADDFVCGYHLAILRPDPSALDAKFLFWLSRAQVMRDQLRVAATGVTRMGLRTEALANVELTLPPLEKQRRIADFLDDQVALLDRAIALRQQQDSLALERFRASLSATVLLSPDQAERYRLRDLFEFERNGIWGKDPQGDSDDVVCVRVADFDRDNFRVSDAPTVRNVPEGQRLPRLLRYGDTLLEKSGGTKDKPVGCAVLYEVDGPAVCSNFVAVLRPRDEVVPHYAGFVMAAHYQERRNGPFLNQTTGIQNLDSHAYLRLAVGLPDRAEQQARVDSVLRDREYTHGLRVLYRRQADLIQERKQALITAAVTGEFDVTTARRVAVA